MLSSQADSLWLISEMVLGVSFLKASYTASRQPCSSSLRLAVSNSNVDTNLLPLLPFLLSIGTCSMSSTRLYTLSQRSGTGPYGAALNTKPVKPIPLRR